MKKLLILCTCLWLASACNRPVELTVNPEGIAGAGSPEFNFLVVPGPYPVSSMNDGMSGVDMELYLRQLSFDADAAYFFEFTSNNYGSLEVGGDTLYTGDKIVLPYRLFKNYRLKGTYKTKGKGNQTLTFTVSAGTITKKATASFNL
jgi:hypothetical protein